MKVKVAGLNDAKDGQMIGVEIKGNMYLLAKVDGSYYVLDGLCSHMKGRLWEGKLSGTVVKCPKHGAEYDLRTGMVSGQVKIPLIGKAKGQRSYPVMVEADGIYIEA